MNKVILIGKFTKDPELKFAPGSGTGVSKFQLAVARKFKKGESDFISCVAFGKTAETISQYCTKGKEIAIEGHIQTGSYDKQDGTKVYTTDVIIDSFEFTSGSKGGNTQPTTSGNWESQENFNNDITPVDYGDMPF